MDQHGGRDRGADARARLVAAELRKQCGMHVLPRLDRERILRAAPLVPSIRTGCTPEGTAAMLPADNRAAQALLETERNTYARMIHGKNHALGVIMTP